MPSKTLSEAVATRGLRTAADVLTEYGYTRGKETVVGTVHKAGNVTAATWHKRGA